MLSGIALFLTLYIGQWIMLLPVAIIRLGVYSLREKINPTAFQGALALDFGKGHPSFVRWASIVGFLTALMAYQIFDHFNADFSRWIVAVTAVVNLAQAVSNFSSGPTFMGHIRTGSALGMLVWFTGPIFLF